MQKLTWYLMTLLAIGVAAYAGTSLLLPEFRTPFVQDIVDELPIALAAHLAGGGVAIIIGAFQVNKSLRIRFLPAHRWLGRAYVIAVMIGGVAGLVLATRSFGGLVTHVGFGLMAICWLGTTATAYVRIRQGEVADHRVWMIRSYALTLAAVTLRIYLGLSTAAGIEFSAAYPVISWLCWVPNILVAEWFVLSRTRSPAVPG